jgi:hypothetical protein
MMDQAFRRAPLRYGLFDILKSQPATQAITGRPADDTTCEEINDDSETQPSFFRP